MTKRLGIDFAPINVPRERRLQTLALIYYCSQFLVVGLCAFIFLVSLAFTKLFFIPIAYIFWWFYDKETCNRGGRRSHWVRNWRIWNWYRDYFPVSLIKTAELDATKNYIFGIHPHGILCFGSFLNFATEATGFSRLFPGIRPFLLTLEGQFTMPLHRELFLMTGSCSANRPSMEWILRNEGTGNALCLIVGGAVEALDAIPGKFDITLHDRKGFVKLALRHGAQLVPVISFGENDVYLQKDRDDKDFVKQMQKRLTKVAGFSPPLFHGRGIFQYSFGLLPFRKPITTIVGAPIAVDKVEKPSQELIDDLHEKYVQSISKLYEDYKVKCGYGDVPLIIK